MPVDIIARGLATPQSTRNFGQAAGGRRYHDLVSGASSGVPFAFESYYATFNGTQNPVAGFGYNMSVSGNPVVAGEPQFGWRIEGKYDIGATDDMEQYWEAYSSDGAIQHRPIFASVDRSGVGTARTTFIKQLGFYGPAAGVEIFSAVDGPTIASDFKSYVLAPGNFQMFGKTGAGTIARLNTASGQAATVYLGYSTTQDTAGFNTASVGVFDIFAGTTANRIRMRSINSNGALAVGLNVDLNDAALSVCSEGSWNNQLVLRVRQKSTANQGDMLRLEDSAAVVHGGANKDGYFYTAKTAAPADADIAASQCFFWFDATNGAAKIKFKAKEAGGTVRTGEVALA